MWIFPVSPEALAHPAKCEDCGASIIWASTQAGKLAALNEGFKVNQSISLGDGTHLQLLPHEASHDVTCAKKGRGGPAMTRRGRRKKHVGV